MFDKVNMTLFADDLKGVDPLEITKYLYNTEQRLKETGELTANGVVGGMKAYITPDYINLKGSLPKVLYRSNCFTLDRSSTEEAITKLSDLLHVDIRPSKVSEIEFGTVFPMRYPVGDYFPLLGETKGLKRCAMVEKETLMYWQKTRAREIIFYDKAAEVEDKGKDIPTAFKDCNLLRYEIRYRSGVKGGLSKRLGVDKLEASTLYDRAFYDNMLSRYKEEYDSITKIKVMTMNEKTNMLTAAQAVKLFVAANIYLIGREAAEARLTELKPRLNKQNYQRTKKEIEKIFATGAKVEDGAKVDELTKAVYTVVLNG